MKTTFVDYCLLAACAQYEHFSVRKLQKLEQLISESYAVLELFGCAALVNETTRLLLDVTLLMVLICKQPILNNTGTSCYCSSNFCRGQIENEKARQLMSGRLIGLTNQYDSSGLFSN